MVALPDEKWIEAVSAVVALKSGTEPDAALADQLKARARERLAPFKVPKHVFFVDDLPRNASGKILKRELRARFAKEVEDNAADKDTAPTVEGAR